MECSKFTFPRAGRRILTFRQARRTQQQSNYSNAVCLPLLLAVVTYSLPCGAFLTKPPHSNGNMLAKHLTAYGTRKLALGGNSNLCRHYTYRSMPLMMSAPTSNDAGRQEGLAYDGYQRNMVQWYPGHIAKAERQLKETFLRAVDVVVEVRDARIAKATSHPKVASWCAGRPRLVVLTHVDQVPTACKNQWLQAYGQFGSESFDARMEEFDGQILNQARQAARERAKYTISDSPNSSKKYQSTNNNDDINQPVGEPLFVNAKMGSGIPALKRAISQAGSHVQERRARRGLKERALRVGILGYPNVGKSALINRLLGRKRARSANTPGVTRSLQWIRVKSDLPDSSGSTGGLNRKSKDFELLDSPGIIPSGLGDSQSDAVLLAACNCIGTAAYDNQEVAAYLCEWMLAMYRLGHGSLAAPGWRKACIERYKFDPLEDKKIVSLHPNLFDDDDDEKTHRRRTGEDMLFDIADNTCQGDPEDAARKILQDFRAGRMGPICLQIAPKSAEDPGQTTILDGKLREQERQLAELLEFEQMQQERAQAARKAAEDLGLDLPPMLSESVHKSEDDAGIEEAPNEKEEKESSDVGKGLFDGW